MIFIFTNFFNNLFNSKKIKEDPSVVEENKELQIVEEIIEEEYIEQIKDESIIEDLEAMLMGGIELPALKEDQEVLEETEEKDKFEEIKFETITLEDKQNELEELKTSIKNLVYENKDKEPNAFSIITLNGEQLISFLAEKGFTYSIADYLGINRSKYHEDCLVKGEPIGKTMSNPYSSMSNFSADYKNAKEWTVKSEGLLQKGINKVIIKPIYDLDLEEHSFESNQVIIEEEQDNDNDYELPDKEYLYTSLFVHGATRINIARYCSVAYDTVKKALQNVFKKYGKLDEETFKRYFLETNRETQKYKENIEFFEAWELINAQEYNPNDFIYLKDKRNNKAMAKAIYLGDGTKENNDILVFKDSYMNPEVDISKKWLDCPWIACERESIISAKIVEITEDNGYIFLQDHVFNSPNLCTCVLLGYITTNAWQDWENVHGKKFENIVDKFEDENYENVATEEEIIEEFEEEKENLNIDDLKSYFEKKKELIRKYNLTMINRFLEEVFETIISSKVTGENKEEFLIEFEKLLNILKDKQKSILIDKYGLCDGNKKTFVEVARNFDFTVGGIKNSSVASIQKIKNSNELEEIKKYFELGKSLKEKEEKLKADIDFIMSLME